MGLSRITCFLALCAFSSIAVSAQNLVADPPQLNINSNPGAYVLTGISITSSGDVISGLTVSTKTTTSSGWLSVLATSAAGTPVLITIGANAQNLSQGTYLGSVEIKASSGQSLSVPVTFTVGAGSSTGSITADPTSLIFTGQAGGPTPSSKQLSVTSSPSGTNFTVSKSTTDGAQWLQVTTATTTPATLTVSVNTTGLTTGTYSGKVTLTPASGTPVDVPVSLTLNSGSTLSVDTSKLQFFYQVGAGSSDSITSLSFNVSAGNPPLNFKVTPTVTQGSGWLSASPLTGTTPQSVTATVSPAGLAAGTYNGNINVTATDPANGSIDIPVTLTVSTGNLISVGAAPAPFVFQTGGATPPSQSVAIGSLGSPLSFTVSTNTLNNGTWLAVAPLSGTTPQSLTIAVNPEGLSPGSYSGNIVVSATGATNSPVTIPITLTVSSTSAISASTKALTLNYQIGGVNEVLSQPIVIMSTGNPVTGTATATSTASSPCGTNFLSVAPNTFTTPATVYATITGAGFASPQICLGSVVLNGGGTPVEVPVTVNVATTPFLNIRPLALSFSAPYQSDVVTQTIDLSMTDNSSVRFTSSGGTTGTGPWLSATLNGGSTPATLTVIADPRQLSIGTYTGVVKITSPALSKDVEIPVTMRVTSSITALLTPTALSFSQTAGGAPPASQNLTLSTGGSPQQPYAVSIFDGTLPAGLVSVSPSSGNTPGQLAVSILQNSLAAGTYTGGLSVSVPSAGNTPVSVPITLRVGAGAPTAIVTPATLTFAYQLGSDPPAGQQLSTTATAGQLNLTASVATESGGDWLGITPQAGATPGSFTVFVKPSNLAVKSYKGTITLTPASGTGVAVTVPVVFNVSETTIPKISSIINAASGVRGFISPGEIITVTGSAMGPASDNVFALTADNTVDTTLAGTRVLFDEFPSPLLYVSAGQINAIVPYEIAGRTTVSVAVEKQGVRSDAFTIQNNSSAPGLFTVTQNGRGQGAILNQDGSYNTVATPAARGSIVQIFGTGEGVTQPGGVTGSVTKTMRVAAGRVRATVGGIPAEVLFAGAAPEAVAGLLQVNVRIPADALSGDVPLVISVDGTNSQTGVTVAVQ